jgi:hypothetical protein
MGRPIPGKKKAKDKKATKTQQWKRTMEHFNAGWYQLEMEDVIVYEDWLDDWFNGEVDFPDNNDAYNTDVSDVVVDNNNTDDTDFLQMKISFLYVIWSVVTCTNYDYDQLNRRMELWPSGYGRGLQLIRDFFRVF